jgi:hypothetical protein
VVHEEPEIGRNDPNIPIDNDCTDNKLDIGIPGSSRAFEDEADKSDAIPTASWRQQAATELERFHLGTRDVDGYEGEDGNDVDATEEEEAPQADD